MKKTTTITIDETILKAAKQILPGQLSMICEKALEEVIIQNTSLSGLETKRFRLLNERERLSQQSQDLTEKQKQVNEELLKIEGLIQKQQEEEQKTRWNVAFENLATLYGITELAYEQYFKMKATAESRGEYIPEEYRKLDASEFLEILRRIIGS